MPPCLGLLRPPSLTSVFSPAPPIYTTARVSKRLSSLLGHPTNIANSLIWEEILDFPDLVPRSSFPIFGSREETQASFPLLLPFF